MMRVVVAPPYGKTKRFAKARTKPGGPIEYFARLLEADDRMRGRVLDVGCGPDYPEPQPMRDVLARCAQLDGVDPDPAVESHPHLALRWHSEFAEADIPRAAYDAVMTYNVVEHIKQPRLFLEKVCAALRAGGVFYAFTPHAVHPFAMVSRSVQRIGLKNVWRWGSKHKVNPYHAYYRLNSAQAVLKAGRDLSFTQLTCHYLPSPQWQAYFPAPLRILPAMYDHLLGLRFQRCAAVLAIQLDKAES
ncbi:MAG: methyltransferase domain-containing protein [Planctomycetes bacterium]|nr:methyltransferase domain-containing protein [Planctomycetota bacterium]